MTRPMTLANQSSVLVALGQLYLGLLSNERTRWGDAQEICINDGE